jgi:hypothetical protein
MSILTPEPMRVDKRVFNPPRVVFCGNYDACALPGRQQPIHAKVNHWNELPAIRSNPHSYMDLFDSGHE